MSDLPARSLQRSDLVPLTDRLRHLSRFRVVSTALVVAAVGVQPSMVRVDLWLVVLAAALHLAVISAAGRLLAHPRSPVRPPIGGLLVWDCAFVVLVALVWGGPGSPLRYLLVLHAVEASLLASFRTGLRVAVAQTLLVACAVSAAPRRLLGLEPLTLEADGRVELAALVLTCWVAALVSAAMAAANERELRRRRYDLEALARFSAAIGDEPDPIRVVDVFGRAAVEELDLSRVAVLVPVGPDELVSMGPEGPSVRLRIAPGSRLDEVRAGATRLVRRDGKGDDLEAVLPGARHVVLLPLTTHRGCGVVVAEHDWRHGSRMEARVLSMFERYRDHLGLRLSNVWLVQSLWKEATTDRLTGVANRRHFEGLLAGAIERAARGDSFSLALVDVDHFKKVNDTFGHAAGDEVLRSVARCFAGSVRSGDVVARFGGEEFAVLLRGARGEDVRHRVDELRRALPEATQPYGITASFGLAAFAEGADDADTIIRRADDAMYEAKRTGRNRVVEATEPAPNPLTDPTRA